MDFAVPPIVGPVAPVRVARLGLKARATPAVRLRSTSSPSALKVPQPQAVRLRQKNGLAVTATATFVGKQRVRLPVQVRADVRLQQLEAAAYPEGYTSRRTVVAPAIAAAGSLAAFPLPMVMPADLALANGARVTADDAAVLPCDVASTRALYALPATWNREARTRWRIFHAKSSTAEAASAASVWGGHAAMLRAGTTPADRTARRTPTVGGNPSDTAIGAWPSARFDGVDDVIKLPGVAAWTGATALTASVLFQAPVIGGLGPILATEWETFDPDGATIEQSHAGIEAEAAATGFVYFVSRQQQDLSGGFTLAFDYTVHDANGAAGGTFISVGAVRGDGSAGRPANVANWTAPPHDDELQAHGSGWRVSFDTKNNGSPSVADEVRIRNYPAYDQFKTDEKIVLARDTLYRIEITLAGTTVTWKSTAPDGTQKTVAYTSATFALPSPANLIIRLANGRAATLANLALTIAGGTTVSGGLWGIGADLTTGAYSGLRLNATRNVSMRLHTELGSFGVTSTEAVNDGLPHVLSVTWAAGNRPKLYLDGRLLATSDFSSMTGLAGTALSIAGDLWLGLGPGGAGNGYWKGKLGELAVAFVERSAAWVATHADALLRPQRCYGVGADDAYAAAQGPVAVPLAGSTTASTPIELDAIAAAENASASTLDLALTTEDGPLEGTALLTGSPARIRYTPKSGFSGVARGSYRVAAGAKASVSAWAISVGTSGGETSSWTILAEEALPAATTTVEATPANIAAKIAAATPGTEILLTGGPFGNINLNKLIGTTAGGKAVIRPKGANLSVQVNGSINVQASGWVVSGLKVSGAKCINLATNLGANGYFRATRCELTPTSGSDGVFSTDIVNWWGGGIDYCTINCSATKSWGMQLQCHEERDILIYRNYIHGYSLIRGDDNTKAHAIFTGLDNKSTGWRPARIIGWNIFESGGDQAFSLEVKGSRVLIINNLVRRGAGVTLGNNFLQHRNGFYCVWVGNKIEAGCDWGLYGSNDILLDNEAAIQVGLNTGNYHQSDFLRTLANQPPTADEAARQTTFWTKYKGTFAGGTAGNDTDPVNTGSGWNFGDSPSPRPAAQNTLLLANNFALLVGDIWTDPTVRRRPRAAFATRIEQHTGTITLATGSVTIDAPTVGNDPVDGISYDGPRTPTVGLVNNSAATARLATVPAGYGAPAGTPNAILFAGGAMPAKYNHIPLTTANCGANAA